MSENGRREVFEKFSKFYVSDFSSEVVAAWNKLRVEVLEEALSKHLIPMAMTWWRNLIKEGQEEWVGNACVKVLDGVRFSFLSFRVFIFTLQELILCEYDSESEMRLTSRTTE